MKAGAFWIFFLLFRDCEQLGHHIYMHTCYRIKKMLNISKLIKSNPGLFFLHVHMTLFLIFNFQMNFRYRKKNY